MTVPSALAVSAVDPAGGLLATDLLAFGALGIAGSGLVTAVTADGLRLPGPIQEVPVALVRAGLDAALSARRFTARTVRWFLPAPITRTRAASRSSSSFEEESMA